MDKFTILMPTYNCGTFLDSAIKSIISQTYKEFEFLIVDDGSTDNTEEIVTKYKDSRINYIKRSHFGLVDSLNYGLKIASNEWIARFDSDDIAHFDWLFKMRETLQNNIKINIVSCWYAIFKNNKILYIVKTPTNNAEIKKRLLLHGVLCHSGVVFPKNTILEIGGYREETIEDIDLWMRLRTKVTFYNINEVLIFVRSRTNSVSKNNIELFNQLMFNTYNSEINKINDLSSNEENILLGWREYFYGNKNKARKYWKTNLLNKPKVLLAYLLTLLPQNIFCLIKEFNLKYRILFLFSQKKYLQEFLTKYNS